MRHLLKRWMPERQNLSPLEQRVLDYLFDHPERVIRCKAEDLAKTLFVSTATISRTCQALGFRGFQELKYALQQELQRDPGGSEAPASFPLQQHVDRFRRDFEETIRRLDYEKIRQAAELIHESPRIEFFGVGNSLFPCLEAAKKLTFAGKWCNARTDWDDLEVTAQSMSGTDLAFLVSYSGETRSILHFARTLKANRVKMISLTGPHPNRLEKMADIALKGHMTDCCFGNLDLCSRFPMNLLLDLVIIEYIRRWKTPSQSGEP
ncbi:MAG: MurR/RpiR family transcriptional regulator [Bacillota bacterium]|jgi:DNA-binding MurR/RpiR family transcriptional regulator|uniref:MurR/RpiR family transcriptional regulator n=1 Tax=Planifilum fulgidum TaxID=201973 RepID=UPI001FDFBA16|nr:MurR/RpiR family transcriptional regulator [Planifilum fulgidum]